MLSRLMNNLNNVSERPNSSIYARYSTGSNPFYIVKSPPRSISSVQLVSVGDRNEGDASEEFDTRRVSVSVSDIVRRVIAHYNDGKITRVTGSCGCIRRVCSEHFPELVRGGPSNLEYLVSTMFRAPTTGFPVDRQCANDYIFNAPKEISNGFVVSLIRCEPFPDWFKNQFKWNNLDIPLNQYEIYELFASIQAPQAAYRTAYHTATGSQDTRRRKWLNSIKTFRKWFTKNVSENFLLHCPPVRYHMLDFDTLSADIATVPTGSSWEVNIFTNRAPLVAYFVMALFSMTHCPDPQTYIPGTTSVEPTSVSKHVDSDEESKTNVYPSLPPPPYSSK